MANAETDAVVFIDSHCHIDLAVFDDSRDQVIQNAREHGVERLLVPGLSVAQFSCIKKLQAQYAQQMPIDIALGLHPHFLQVANLAQLQAQIDALIALADDEKNSIVAIGEFGIDAHISLEASLQAYAFEQQVLLAKRLNKPVILHHRQSHNQIIELLKRHRFTQGGVIHAFSGSTQLAQTYIDMGFYLGVGGTITYARANKTRQAISAVDARYLLLETDSPDMPLCGYQGQCNTPAQVSKVASCLAELHGLSVEQLAKQTTRNYYALFGS